jgi:CDP-4-dehydro-6-deoxyglucose reductase, E3
MQTFDAEVTRVTDLTHDVREIEMLLRDPPAIAFAAGQFVSFRVPAETRAGVVTRAYSIASPPSRRASIDLLFNLVPGGPGSTYLYSLQVGSRSQFRGPAGTFVLRDDPDRDLLLVATGTGIAPMRSMILTRLPCTRRVTLFWGLRHERDVYYEDDLHDLAARHPEFTYAITLSQPSPAWRGPAGRVQRLVEEHIRSVSGLAVYICGNASMIRSVRELIRQIGDCPVHYEQYYLDQSEP